MRTDFTREISEVYSLASGGDPEAFAWLLAWHGWAHDIDDFIDEPGHAKAEIVDLCARGVVLTSCGFYRRHAEAIGPIIAIVAEQYRSSLTALAPMNDALRISGNQVVLIVAYIKGGAPLLRQVSDRLWPIVRQSQFA